MWMSPPSLAKIPDLSCHKFGVKRQNKGSEFPRHKPGRPSLSIWLYIKLPPGISPLTRGHSWATSGAEACIKPSKQTVILSPSDPLMKIAEKIADRPYNTGHRNPVRPTYDPTPAVRTSPCPGTSKTQMSTSGLTPTSIGSQSERTGRRSHKMMSVARRKEPVWPPALEEALLEALRLYRPVSKSGRPLRRFTKRNVFISRHIFNKTGKSRTPKQVGSRLQQISESSPDAELKKLITNRDFDSIPGSPEEHATTLPSSPTIVDNPSEYTASTLSEGDAHEDMIPPSTFDSSHDATPIDRQSLCSNSFTQFEYTDPTTSRYNYSYNNYITLFVELISSDVGRHSAAQLGLDADISEQGVDFILSLKANENLGQNSFYNARRLSNIPSNFLFCQPPQLTVLSPFLSPDADYSCTYGVFMDGSMPVHTESVRLLASSAPPEHPSEAHVWCAPILPKYWEVISRRPELDRYTIMLEISELGGVARSGLSNSALPPKPRFSVAFNFKPPTSSTTSCVNNTNNHNHNHNHNHNTAAINYPNPAFEQPTLTSVFPVSPTGGLSSSSSISNISSSSQDSDLGRMPYTWFDPATNSYAHYPLIGAADGTQAHLGHHDHDLPDLSATYVFPPY